MGYTCGLWSLFHILVAASAGSARHGAASAGTARQVHGARNVNLLAKAGRVAGSGGVANAGAVGATRSSGDAPARTLQRIRGFVAYFFGCGACVRHFLATFDSCALGRCALAPSDVRGTALWLWRMHNAVTAHVASEFGAAAPAPWPPRSSCKTCWPTTTRRASAAAAAWNASAVYAYLNLEYVPHGRVIIPHGVHYRQPRSTALKQLLFLTVVVIVVCVCCVCFGCEGGHGLRARELEEKDKDDDEDEPAHAPAHDGSCGAPLLAAVE
eukprot:NODE_2792_length_874_cov_156.483516.p1 GENE.NODE_2792_length_874_cov_156.483516~~NODE_2792_length_874_cov_156.483516.p1  ORF type:complete len:269 (+),score=37.99 NODE_2792_length_874_cov_156.483516:3-809(+)